MNVHMDEITTHLIGLKQDCCVLNRGNGAWAFAELAQQLATALGVDVAEEPRRFNYVLQVDESFPLNTITSFIPITSISLAADKRLVAEVFSRSRVATPMTELVDTFDAVLAFVRAAPEREWCLKYPTGCGATGHRLITPESSEPPNWPRPFVVQEFVRCEHPEVYRAYCAGGELFGWVVRRYPSGVRPSPWVAHARGARYVRLPERPGAASEVARSALQATGLWNSFGCVDLLRRPTGEWVALEVGTDGLYNHVDRELGDAELEEELQRRVATAFWAAARNHLEAASVRP